MSSQRLRHEASAEIAATAEALFDHLDDPMHLAEHMTRPSPMMAGAAMRLDTDAGRGRALGSVIRMQGRVLGIPLQVEEAVTEREPPWRKTWETLGEPRLLVIGAYRMGFTLAPRGAATRLSVWIDWALPERAPARWLGRLFGPAYARWCVNRMLADAVAAFGTS